MNIKSIPQEPKNCDKIVIAIREKFVGIESLYGLYKTQPKGTKSTPITKKQKLTDQVIGDHITGVKTIGVYPYKNKNSYKWCCLDFDVRKEIKGNLIKNNDVTSFKREKDNLLHKVSAIYRFLIKEDIHCLLEDSYGGYHIWIFLEEGISSVVAYDFVNAIKKDEKFERFPKNRSHQGVGNFVRLPGKYHSCSLGGEYQWSKFFHGKEWYSLEDLENWKYAIETTKNSKEKIEHFIRKYGNINVSKSREKRKTREVKEIKSLLECHFNISITNEKSFCCPFHPDKEPSGSIFEQQGRELFKCHSTNCRMSGKAKNFLQLRRLLSGNKVFKKSLAQSQVSSGNEIPKLTPDEMIRLTHGEIVRKFCKSRSLLYTQKCFWHYNSGIWRKKGQQNVKADIQEFIGLDFASVAKIKNLLDMIKNYLTREYVPFDQNKNILCLKNGVLDIYTKDFSEQNPRFCFTKKLNFKYDTNAKYPTWIRFLKSLEFSEIKIKRLQEWFGYCLTSERKIQKALYLLGKESNGKSIVLDTLRNLLGGYAACCDLTRLINGRFDSSSLEGIRCNISGDVEVNNIQMYSGVFKDLITATKHSAEKKGKDRYEFTPEFKLAFAANGLLNVSREDEAFWRRLDIFVFKKIFQKEEQDGNLREKIDAELSGILNWAIEGLHRVVRNDWKFSPCPEVENIDKNKISAFSKVTVASFLMDFCEFNVNKYTKAKELYNKYVEVCKKQSTIYCDSSTFGKQISKQNIKKNRKKFGDKQVAVYEGIMIKN
ncbi:phage/plasmid primase, P4 family [Candidatus Uabimicrobium sp. HlEnr_7]|uniref:phage/plasmid primase, P4 family n=1 Tax=Candidatus Uabimicrobium helgolandensis TaxID=3095367 RepID=UPI00355898DB